MIRSSRVRPAVVGFVAAFALVSLAAPAPDPARAAGFTVRDANLNGQMNQDFHSRNKGTDNPPRLVVTFGS